MKLRRYFRPIEAFRRILFIPHRLPSGYVRIAATNRCNFDCKMCGRKLIGVPDAHMPLADIKAIIDRVPAAVGHIDFTGWGETLMHPDILEGVRYAKAKGFTTAFSTNGSLLDMARTDGILESKLDVLFVSIDDVSGYCEESYLGHGGVNRVVDNLKRFMGRRGDGRPWVEILTTIHTTELVAYERVLTVAKGLRVDMVSFMRLLPIFDNGLRRPGLEEEMRVCREVEKVGKRIGQPVNTVLSQKRGLLKLLYRFDRLCVNTYQGVYINHGGEVTPCCNLPRLAMGNIFEAGLEEIFSGPKFKRFRRDQSEVCGSCDFGRGYHKVSE